MSMEEEIKQLQDKTSELEDRIKGLEKRIRLLESEQEENTSVYYVAKAVHEMQNDLKKLHPELMFSNLVYAPDTVGGV